MHWRRKTGGFNLQNDYLQSPPDDALESDKPPTPRYYTFVIRIILIICLFFSACRLLYFISNDCGRPPGSSPTPIRRYIAEVAETSSATYYTNSQPGLRRCRSSLEDRKSENFDTLELSIVAYAGGIKELHPGFKNFMTSLSLSGYKNIVLKAPAETEKDILNVKGAPNYTAEAVFWVNRLREFQRTAASFPPTHILIFCDAFDVLFGLSPSVFLARFESLQSDVVFSAEMLCDTISCRRDMDLTDWFTSIAPSPKNPYKYLNAGMLAGRAAAVSQFMACAISYAVAGRDDQTAFAFCFRDFHHSSARGHEITVTLDYYSLLFGNIPPEDSLFAKAFDLDENRHFHLTDSLSVPYLYRKVYFSHPLLDKWGSVYSPVMVHVPGLAYRPLGYSQFNPCQNFLRWRYNQFAAMFEHGLPPNIFHPFLTSQSNQRPVTAATSGDGAPRGNEVVTAYVQSIPRRRQQHAGTQTTVESEGPTVVLCAVFDAPTAPLVDHIAILTTQIRSFLISVLMDNNVVIVRKVYVLLSLCKASEVDTTSSADKIPPAILIDGISELLEDYRMSFDLSITSTSSPDRSGEKRQGDADSRGGFNHHAESSVLNAVLLAETDPQTRLVVVWLKEHSQRPSNFVDILYRHHYLHSGSAFGFGGWMIDVDSDADTATDDIHIRSSGNHHAIGLTSVDILDFVSGAIFSRAMFGAYVDEDNLLDSNEQKEETKPHESLCSRRHKYGVEEEVRASAILSYRGIPRIAVPMDLSHVLSRRDPVKPIPHSALIHSPSTCHVLLLLPYFKMSWVSSSDAQATVDECSAIDSTFHPLPTVADLPGFSWQMNWDSDSGTSPCTTHLITRIVSGVSLMGVGQYMGEGQLLRSTNGVYEVQLESDASFCLYNISEERRSRMGCVYRPSAHAQKSVECSENGDKGYYAAVWLGELCVFCGRSPAMGGRRSESGHGPPQWCTSRVHPPPASSQTAATSVNMASSAGGNILISNGMQIADEGKEGRNVRRRTSVDDAMERVKARIREKMKAAKEEMNLVRIAKCHQQSSLDEDLWEKLYLHVSDDGLFGLYYSAGNKVSPHDIVQPRDRARYLAAGRCFTLR